MWPLAPDPGQRVPDPHNAFEENKITIPKFCLDCIVITEAPLRQLSVNSELVMTLRS
jgi:hypothetical protein